MGGGRLHRHSLECALGTGMPRQLRCSHVRQGRRPGEDRGRSREPVQPRSPVSAVPRLQGNALPSRSPAPSAEAGQEGPRQERVYPDQLGRGIRNHRTRDEEGHRYLWPRGDLGHPGNRSRHQRVRTPHGAVLRHPQLRHGFPLRPSMLRAPHLLHGPEGWWPLHLRLFAVLPRPLRQSRVGTPRVHSGLGQQSRGRQLRWHPGPLDRRVHETR